MATCAFANQGSKATESQLPGPDVQVAPAENETLMKMRDSISDSFMKIWTTAGTKLGINTQALKHKDPNQPHDPG